MLRVIVVFIYLLNFINCFGQKQPGFFTDSLDESYCFFFTGECHLKKDYDHSLTLFKQLYHSHHVRKIILEFPQELEFGFNKYINDLAPKDSDYIDLIALRKINTENELHDFLKKLRLFNLSKSSMDDKISIICPDICNSIKYALLSIILTTEKYGIISNPELDDLFYKILKLKMKHFDNNQDEKTVVLVYELKYYLDSYPTEFKDLYKSDFTAIKREINCLYKSTLAYQTNKGIPDSIREQLIFENIMDDYYQNPGTCYYGNYGQLHTLLNCNLNEVTSGKLQINKSMAQRLNETKELKGKVVTMPYYYLNNDLVSNNCHLKIFGKNIISTEEEFKIRNLLGTRTYYYLPIKNNIERKELESMFNFLIIKND